VEGALSVASVEQVGEDAECGEHLAVDFTGEFGAAGGLYDLDQRPSEGGWLITTSHRP
jgi:hypothetical protein